LKFALESVKEVTRANTRDNVSKLLNSTQIFVGDVANFFFACEMVRSHFSIIIIIGCFLENNRLFFDVLNLMTGLARGAGAAVRVQHSGPKGDRQAGRSRYAVSCTALPDQIYFLPNSDT
jgi:hypothetical protein